MPEARLQVILEGVDNVSDVFRGIGKTLDDVEGKFASFANKARSAGDRLSSVGKDLSLRLTAPIAGLGLAIGKLALDAEKTETVRDAFRAMSAGVVSDLGVFTSAIKTASSGMFSNFEIMKAATKALAFIGKESFTDFQTDFASIVSAVRPAAKALGLSLTEATDFIIEGVGKLRPLMLKNLGITIDLKEVSEDYAESLGIEAEALTDVQKRNAVLQASLKFLQERYGVVDTATLGVSEKMAILQARFKDVRDELGAAFLPILNQLLERFIRLAEDVGPKLIARVQELINWWDGLSSTWKMVIIGTLAFVAVLGPLLFILGQIIISISAIVSASSLFIGVLGLLLGPVGAVVLAIGLFGFAILNLWKNWEVVSAMFIEAWNLVSSSIGSAIQGVVSVLQSLWVATQQVFSFIGDFLAGVVVFWAEILAPVFMPLAEALLALELLLIQVFERLGLFFADIWLRIRDIFMVVWTEIGVFLSTITTAISGLITEWLGKLADAFASTWNSIKESVAGPMEAIKSTVTGAINAILGVVNSAISAIQRLREMGGAVGGIRGLIPRFQAGGLVTRPTLAMIGEAGPEAIIPLRRGFATGGGVTINLVGDFFTDAESAEKWANQIARVIKYQLRL